jgi:hypothetical protein
MFRELQLTNFKNFRDATLELGPFTVLVGANASGKSNLRDAFPRGARWGHDFVENLTGGSEYVPTRSRNFKPDGEGVPERSRRARPALVARVGTGFNRLLFFP